MLKEEDTTPVLKKEESEDDKFKPSMDEDTETEPSKKY